jgi:hypothetical protein
MLNPYEAIDPIEWRRRHDEAIRRMSLPPRKRIPIADAYLLDGEEPLGEGVDLDIPERFLPHLLRQRELPTWRRRCLGRCRGVWAY